ncbi:MAG: leucyl aminopeptidase [Wenzhouxiangella sp.]|jgi:leucyl aminopeptidase|nr:leucyl aminopeptidase [Wenzhouxiangella sp.]
MHHAGLALIACLLTFGAQAQRSITFEPYELPGAGAVAVAVQHGAPLEGAFAEVDAATDGALGRAVANAGFVGDRGTLLNLHSVGPYDQVVLVGVGAEAPSPRLLEDIGALVGQTGLLSAAPEIHLLWPDAGVAGAGAHLALGVELGQYTFRRYRSPRPEQPVLGQGLVVLRVAAPQADASLWTSSWQPVAEGVRLARDLVTEPGNAIYPQTFVERVRATFEGVPNIRIEVLDERAMAELGMGAMLAVGQGSARPPRLLAIHYRGGPADEAPLVFVGKGITFDTGGISIKPSQDMWRMKFDMSGAAGVTGALLGLAKRGAPVNAVAVAALAENMPSGTATRPGDVIRTMSGQTFEIMSTDAEGRMVLVDAVTWAQRELQPRLLINIATLTGSQVTALGDEYAGLFSRHDELADQLLVAGAASGEELWRLPLHPSYAKDLESPIADLRNGGSGRGAGAGVAAFFVGNWVAPELPWAHLDMASMAWRNEATQPTVPPGASGFGVRLLDRFVRDHFEGAGR